MDQPNTSTDLAREAQNLRERLARLEEIVRLGAQYDRERNYQAWAGLQMQMDGLIAEVRAREHANPIGTAGWLKVMLAILLPYLALLMTGSIKVAQKVAAVAPGL